MPTGTVDIDTVGDTDLVGDTEPVCGNKAHCMVTECEVVGLAIHPHQADYNNCGCWY